MRREDDITLQHETLFSGPKKFIKKRGFFISPPHVLQATKMSYVDGLHDERFDGMYMNIAQQAHGIDPLLNSMFSFLRRKTDFFSGATGADTAMAVKKVTEVLQLHRELAEKDFAKKKEKDLSDKVKKAASAKAKAKKLEEKRAKAEAEAEKSKVGDDGVMEIGSDGFDVSAAATTTAAAAPAAAPAAAEPPKPPSEEEATPVAKKEGDNSDEEEDKTPPPAGNGGTVEGKYVWTQTLSEVALTIPVPATTRGKDINLTMKKGSFSCGLKGADKIADGKFHANIIVDDSFWTLEDSGKGEKFIVVNLQKFNQQEWWSCVMEGDPKINTQKVQPENSKLADLDGDTRQTVEKMMFDQRAKAMGTPTSDESKKAEILEKFKKSHPEMDFSNAKMS